MNLSEWVTTKDDAFCRECFLSPLGAWFVETLKEKNHPGLAQELSATLRQEAITPENAASAMDRVLEQSCKIDQKVCSALTELKEGMFIAVKPT